MPKPKQKKGGLADVLRKKSVQTMELMEISGKVNKPAQKSKVIPLSPHETRTNTGKSPDGEMNTRASEHRGGEVHGEVNTGVVKCTRASEHRGGEVHGEVNTRASEHRDTKVNTRASEHQGGEINTCASEHPKDIKKDQKPASIRFTRQQLMVYRFLAEHEGEIINQKTISRSLYIPYESVRRIVRRLKEHNIIKASKGSLSHEITFTVDRNADPGTQLPPTAPIFCASEHRGGEMNTRASEHRGGEMNTRASEHRGGEMNFSYIDDDDIFNKTSSCARGNNIEHTIKHHPEFAWWRKYGLTPQHVQRWLKKFPIDEFALLQDLKYFSHSATVENSTIKIKTTPMSYYTGILEGPGSHGKPVGYLSYEQKQLEQVRQELEETKRQRQKLEKLRREIDEEKQKISFEKMMADENSLDFKECLSRLAPSMQRRRPGPAKTAALRKCFDEMTGYVDK